MYASKDVPATLGSDVTQTFWISLHVKRCFYRLTEKYRPVQYTLSVLNWSTQLSEDFTQTLRECIITARSLWVWGQRITVLILIYRTEGRKSYASYNPAVATVRGRLKRAARLFKWGTQNVPLAVLHSLLSFMSIYFRHKSISVKIGWHTTDVAMHGRKIFFPWIFLNIHSADKCCA